MHEFIDSSDDVLALAVSGKITGSDLDAIMTRLDSAMARHEQVHMFVETRTIDGIELSGLPAYTARAMPLFGQLNRFGRFAIVSDQAWIRLASRLESSFLPFIIYLLFDSDQRPDVLACVYPAYTQLVSFPRSSSLLPTF